MTTQTTVSSNWEIYALDSGTFLFENGDTFLFEDGSEYLFD